MSPTDSDLEYLKGLREVPQWLDLDGLAEWPKLNLGSTAVDDGGLAHLAGLNKLEILSLLNSRCRRFGIPGIYGGYACSMGAPITGLSKTTQVEIYQHFENPVEAKQLFIQLGERNGNPYRTECALMEWVGQGYPGTWSEWWEEHRDVDQE